MDTVVSFSAAVNQVAPDPPGGGINSYTAALVHALGNSRVDSAAMPKTRKVFPLWCGRLETTVAASTNRDAYAISPKPFRRAVYRKRGAEPGAIVYQYCGAG
jgi:hypothetical protein